MPKEKSPPVNLDKYLEGRNHKYMTYEKASRLYGLPFWGFVSVAKEAKATWKLRKTAIVDTVVFEKYLEEYCAISVDEDVFNEMEDYGESVVFFAGGVEGKEFGRRRIRFPFRDAD